MKLRTESLRVNQLESPVIDSVPTFSWLLDPGDREGQRHYRINILDVAGKEVWGREGDSDDYYVLAKDCQLEPDSSYQWHLTVTGDAGGSDNATATFRTGKMGTAWVGKWITGHNCLKADDVLHAVYLRKQFTLRKPKTAMLYIVGLGMFEVYINGTRVGDDFLRTPYTAYDKTILYQAYDVTDLITDGSNAIGVCLGNGFYNCFTEDAWKTSAASWRSVPKLLCDLHVEQEDGITIVASDPSWESIEGPIVFNGIRHGEVYDARLEKDGWTNPDYMGESFPAKQTLNPGAKLEVMEMEPIRLQRVYSAKEKYQIDGKWIYDIGQNVSGIAHLTFRGKAGSEYTIRYSDSLKQDSSLKLDELNSFVKNYSFQTDTYIKRSDEAEAWHPSFSFYGVQYLEISGPEADMDLSDVEIWALHNDFTERGRFTTSNESLNGIQHMAVYSTKACSLNTMASDTVREKMSWTGDTGSSADQMLLNFGAEQFLMKWMQDLRDSQRPAGSLPCIVPTPGWGFNSIVGPDWCNPMYSVPWAIYKATGEVKALELNYDALTRHCDYMRSMAINEIVDYGLGDWCVPFEGPALSVNMASFKCPVALTDTAHRYAAVLSVAEWARILGREADEVDFRNEATRIRQAFRAEFFNEDDCSVASDCQTAVAFMVYYGFAESSEIPILLSRLIELIEAEGNHLDFGLLGSKAVLNVLGKYGYVEKALQIINNPTYPSYRYWLDQGATTLWECWNGEGSHCHHMFSEVSAFFYKYVGGITQLEPGYKRIHFKPAVGNGIEQVHCSIDTARGLVECSFETDLINGSPVVRIHIEVPHGSSAVLELPGVEHELNGPGSYDFIVVPSGDKKKDAHGIVD